MPVQICNYQVLQFYVENLLETQSSYYYSESMRSLVFQELISYKTEPINALEKRIEK